MSLELRVGLGSCGVANGAREVWRAVDDAARSYGQAHVVKTVGCRGMCHHEPLVEVVEDGRHALYVNVGPETAPLIVRRHVRPTSATARARLGSRRLVDRLVADRAPQPRLEVDPALEDEGRIVLENCGVVDPLSIDDALARGAYAALEQCVRDRSPDEGIAEILAAGLRGRGGAGFPTGRKWEIARRQPGPKYVVGNGDEGDPGAFMDRLVLESDPHRVVEGLAIAAWATGAEDGFFYVRAEYPLAVRHLREAIRRAEEGGFLGEDVLGSGVTVRLSVREGAGAFVCGEETALIASLEGRRGVPRLRPPYPVEVGYRGRPTTINNVETLACVPWILRHGADAFASRGTATSKGTKVFALAGKIRRGGLVEVPMGTTIREVVDGRGGGMAGSARLKAVQLGGPSGGCIPAALADTPIDYESLAETGAIMGSGGLVVLDERDCMVDISRYFLAFTCDESCGKCTFCRVGTQRMLEILERMCQGRARPDELAKLEELADRVGRTSLCGLGQTAPNPVLTAIRYYRDEFEAHLEGRCPALACPDLIRYRITDTCIGCTLCAQACPVDAIESRPYERHQIDDDKCTRCDMCLQACQDDAVEIVSP